MTKMFRTASAATTAACRSRVAALAIATGLVLSGSGIAVAAGPFAGMNGAWSGTGTVSLDGGTKERIRCRAQYVVKNDDNNFQQALRCASESYKFEVNTYVDHSAGSLSGYWTELINNVKGEVTGKVSGSHVQALLRGTGFSADFDLVTRGNQQSVVIVPGKDTDTNVQRVSITMRKGG